MDKEEFVRHLKKEIEDREEYARKAGVGISIGIEPTFTEIMLSELEELEEAKDRIFELEAIITKTNLRNINGVFNFDAGQVDDLRTKLAIQMIRLAFRVGRFGKIFFEFKISGSVMKDFLRPNPR